MNHVYIRKRQYINETIKSIEIYGSFNCLTIGLAVLKKKKKTIGLAIDIY